MKKTLRYLAVILFIMFLPSCWPFGWTEYYFITDVSISVVEPSDPDRFDRDPQEFHENRNQYATAKQPLTDMILLLVKFEYTEVEEAENNKVAKALSSLSLIQDAHAFQPGRKVDNKMMRDSYTVQLDTDIEVDGTVVFAGRDLTTYHRTKDRIFILSKDNPNLNYEGDLIVFDKEFFSAMTFASSEFKVTVTCNTTDGRDFSAETTVTVDESKLISPNP